MTSELDQRSALESQVLETARIVVACGLVEAFGHVSARLDDDHMIITPGAALATCGRGDLVVVDLRDQRVDGGTNPPLEAPLHAAIYRQRPDVGAIVRFHARWTSAFAAARQALRPVHDLGCVVRGETTVHDDPRLVSDAALGDAAAEKLADADALLLAGNGALTVGPNLETATVRAVYLEETASLTADSMVLGGAVPLPDDFVHQLGNALLAPHHIGRTWQLLRSGTAPT